MPRPRNHQVVLSASLVALSLFVSPANIVLRNNLDFFHYNFRLLLWPWLLASLLMVFIYPLMHRSVMQPKATLFKTLITLSGLVVVWQLRFSLEELNPFLEYALIVLVALLLVLLVRKTSVATLLSFCAALGAFLLLSESYNSWRIVQESNLELSKLARPAIKQSLALANKPNILHFVFDETSLRSLQKPDGTLDADVVPNIAKFLETATWYRQATSNYSETIYSVGSTLSGELIRPDPLNRHHHIFHEAVQTHGIVYYLKQAGYNVEIFGQHIPYKQFFTGLADKITGDEDVASSQKVDFVYAILKRLTFESFAQLSYQIAREPIHNEEQGYPYHGAQMMQLVAKRVENLNNSGNFIFTHVLLPHSPFIFSRDGKLVFKDPIHYQDYLEQIKYTDSLFGQIVEALKRQHLFDSAMIIVQADHGLRKPFDEVLKTEDVSLHESSVGLIYMVPQSLEMLARIPLFIKYPGQHAMVVSDQSAHPLDIFPTIKYALGQEVGAERGRALELPEPQIGIARPLPFLSSTRVGKGLFHWENYRVHQLEAGIWKELPQAQFEKQYLPVDFSLSQNACEEFSRDNVGLRSGQKSFPVMAENDGGKVQKVEVEKSRTRISGWAKVGQELPQKIVMFYRGQFVICSPPWVDRKDIAKHFKNEKFRYSGFEFEVLSSKVPSRDGLEVFALASDGKAYSLRMRR